MGHQWNVDSHSLTRVLERFERARPIPGAGYAGHSVVIHANWNLLLFDSRNRRQLPYQTREDYLGFETNDRCFLGRSTVYARISEFTTAHLFLSLPFEEFTEDATRLINEIQDSFPARLSSKHWKLWRLTKSQGGYVGRKIGPAGIQL